MLVRPFNENRIGNFLIKLIVLVVVLVCIFFGHQYYKSKSIKDNYNIVETRIKNSADLITQRMSYRGLYNYKNGIGPRIPYITERSFNLLYTAIITAGIDLENDVNIVQDDNEIVIYLKKSHIIDKYLLEDSLQIFDSKDSILFFDKGVDVIKAQQEVKENLESIIESDNTSEVFINDFLALSDKKIKEIFTILLTDLLDGRELKFVYDEGE